MDSALRTISYIADIGSIVVLMARRRMSQGNLQDDSEASMSSADSKNQYRMICYVFESEDVSVHTLTAQTQNNNREKKNTQRDIHLPRSYLYTCKVWHLVCCFYM